MIGVFRKSKEDPFGYCPPIHSPALGKFTSSQEWAISFFWSSSVKVVVVVEAIVARSLEKALRQVSLKLPSSWNLRYLTMKHPEKLSWAHQDYFREILQEEQMASQVRVQSAWLENRRELREKYLNVIKKNWEKEIEICKLHIFKKGSVSLKVEAWRYFHI